MIIELPGSSADYHTGTVKQYRMGFFHFSNNNLSIRRACAEAVGKYDLRASKSEDVDICIRVARAPDWVALREEGNVLRHKARKSFGAFVRQMWGWGFHVGYPYKKTGMRGFHLYWVDAREHRITFDLEFERFPLLVCLFLTDFHMLHLFAALALVGGWLGGALVAAPLAAVALAFGWRYLHDDRTAGLGFWPTVSLAAHHYVANVVFVTAATLGALPHGVGLLQCSIFRPTAPKARPRPAAQPASTPPRAAAHSLST